MLQFLGLATLITCTSIPRPNKLDIQCFFVSQETGSDVCCDSNETACTGELVDCEDVNKFKDSTSNVCCESPSDYFVHSDEEHYRYVFDACVVGMHENFFNINDFLSPKLKIFVFKPENIKYIYAKSITPELTQVDNVTGICTVSGNFSIASSDVEKIRSILDDNGQMSFQLEIETKGKRKLSVLSNLVKEITCDTIEFENKSSCSYFKKYYSWLFCNKISKTTTDEVAEIDEVDEEVGDSEKLFLCNVSDFFQESMQKMTKERTKLLKTSFHDRSSSNSGRNGLSDTTLVIFGGSKVLNIIYDDFLALVESHPDFKYTFPDDLSFLLRHTVNGFCSAVQHNFSRQNAFLAEVWCNLYHILTNGNLRLRYSIRSGKFAVKKQESRP